MSVKDERKLDPRVKRTRQLIQSAFAELIIEKRSFENVTVADITERAEINRATFYAHFEDKYDLLNYMVREEFRERVAKNIPLETQRLPDGLRLLTMTVCDFLEQILRRCGPSHDINSTVLTVQVQKCIQEILETWIHQAPGEKPRDCQSSIIAMSLSWMIFGSALQWARGETRYTAEEITDHILQMIYKGFMATADKH
jgi:AcrR family transcriptional regulator